MALSTILSRTPMVKNLEQIRWNDIRQMSEQEGEETLLYLRYYINRINSGAQKEKYLGFIRQLEAGRHPQPGPGNAVGSREKAPD